MRSTIRSLEQIPPKSKTLAIRICFKILVWRESFSAKRIHFAGMRASLGLFAALASPAFAHSGIGINGGQLSQVANRHIEFIGGPAYESIIFALSDARQKPVRAAGSAAYATIIQEQRQLRIPLAPDGENWLSANLPAPLLLGASISVFVELASGETLQAQFEAR
jgi:hypothetical protein